MAQVEGSNGSNGSGVPDRVVRVELISFYHRNPELCETSDVISGYFDYRKEQVCRQLENLVDLRILERVEQDGQVLYRYLPPFSRGDLKGIRYSPALNGIKGLGKGPKMSGGGREES